MLHETQMKIYRSVWLWINDMKICYCSIRNNGMEKLLLNESETVAEWKSFKMKDRFSRCCCCCCWIVFKCASVKRVRNEWVRSNQANQACVARLPLTQNCRLSAGRPSTVRSLWRILMVMLSFHLNGPFVRCFDISASATQFTMKIKENCCYRILPLVNTLIIITCIYHAVQWIINN